MNIRSIYLIGFFLIVALLSTSLYLQFFEGIEPCPLCSLQRIAFCGLGLSFLFGLFAYVKPMGQRIINSLLVFFSFLGMMFAGRQVWLQHFPSASSKECGVSLQYMMKVLPVNEIMQKIFEGSAECTLRSWDFLSLTMAEWSLLWFLFFFALSLYCFRKK